MHASALYPELRLARLCVIRTDSTYIPFIGEKRRKAHGKTDLLRSLRWLADVRDSKASSLANRQRQEHTPLSDTWGSSHLIVYCGQQVLFISGL